MITRRTALALLASVFVPAYARASYTDPTYFKEKREKGELPDIAERLLARGIATRDTNGNVIRLAPPLVIDDATLDEATSRIIDTLRACVPADAAASVAHMQ